MLATIHFSFLFAFKNININILKTIMCFYLKHGPRIKGRTWNKCVLRTTSWEYLQIRGKSIQEVGQNCWVRSSKICTFHPIFLVWKNEGLHTCSMHDRETKYTLKNLVRKSWRPSNLTLSISTSPVKRICWFCTSTIGKSVPEHCLRVFYTATYLWQINSMVLNKTLLTTVVAMVK